MYSRKVKEVELIGRLTSKLYCFIDGHIYYNNQVIKIRYDLLSGQKNNNELSEYEIFDYYDNINLADKRIKETIQHGMPLSQNISHRLIYLTKSRKK